MSLDIRQVRLGVVLEAEGAAAHSLAAAFAGTRYFKVTPAHDRREVASQLVSGKLAGYVVIPQDFETRCGTPRWRAAGPDHHRRLAAEHG